MEMSIKYKAYLKWREDAEWYYYDEDNEKFVLTDKAPEEARISFEKWKKIIADKELRLKLESEWREDAEWYYYDEDNEKFVLTDKAPEEARISFEKWKKINNLDWKD